MEFTDDTEEIETRYEFHEELNSSRPKRNNFFFLCNQMQRNTLGFCMKNFSPYNSFGQTFFYKSQDLNATKLYIQTGN